MGETRLVSFSRSFWYTTPGENWCSRQPPLPSLLSHTSFGDLNKTRNEEETHTLNTPFHFSWVGINQLTVNSKSNLDLFVGSFSSTFPHKDILYLRAEFRHFSSAALPTRIKYVNHLFFPLVFYIYHHLVTANVVPPKQIYNLLMTLTKVQVIILSIKEYLVYTKLNKNKSKIPSPYFPSIT